MPAKWTDHTGQRFGRLIATEYVATPGKQRWRCVCDCGGEKLARTSNLLKGHTTSCGCFKHEVAVANGKITKHGMSRWPEYRIWAGILNRCCNPNTTNGKNYRDRGIGISSEWRNSFEAFFQDMGPRPTPKHEIDRIDNDGNYERGNCRWATKAQNTNNRRVTVRVLYKGRSVTIDEACQMAGGIVGYYTAHDRIKRLGWPVDKAVETPPLTKAECGAFKGAQRRRLAAVLPLMNAPSQG